jgi:hypothetical protein
MTWTSTELQTKLKPDPVSCTVTSKQGGCGARASGGQASHSGSSSQQGSARPSSEIHWSLENRNGGGWWNRTNKKKSCTMFLSNFRTEMSPNGSTTKLLLWHGNKQKIFGLKTERKSATSGQLPFLCTWGAIYGCLEIHLDFIKVVCFYIISLYNRLADQWGRGGGRRTRDR